MASLIGPDVPLGCVKSPFSLPDVMARLTVFRNWRSLRLPMLLLAWMYFWMAWRLEPLRSLSCTAHKTRQPSASLPTQPSGDRLTLMMASLTMSGQKGQHGHATTGPPTRSPRDPAAGRGGATYRCRSHGRVRWRRRPSWSRRQRRQRRPSWGAWWRWMWRWMWRWTDGSVGRRAWAQACGVPAFLGLGKAHALGGACGYIGAPARPGAGQINHARRQSSIPL